MLGCLKEFFVFTVTQSKIKMQTIKYRMKEVEYTKRIARTNEVCAIFQKRNIRQNVLPKLIKLGIEAASVLVSL